MKYALIMIIFFCLSIIGCCDNQKIGTISLSDKHGCFVILKLKKESQHLIIVETCLIKTEINLPGTSSIKISDMVKEQSVKIKTHRLSLPAGWKLQYNNANEWKALDSNGDVLIFQGKYKFENKQTIIDAVWEKVEKEEPYKRESIWSDYKE